jgi:GntR family transcriptional regulator, transcriptional repressor for pyruvate dehydrogenase complex
MADQVETQLRDYIIKRSIRPGDSIHKEMEMAEALGVSSNVVRETLSWHLENL